MLVARPKRRPSVPDIRCEQPFARGAQGAFDNGWLPVPGRVPGGANPKGGTFSGKEPAFAGITARKNDIGKITGDWVDSQIERFTGKKNSLLLWLDEYHIGFDVDHYEKETASGKKEWRLGGDQLAEMEKKWGKLPDTIVVTARSDGMSGIRLFELPRPLTASLGKINDAIEIISRNYRCVAAPPSYHVGVDGYVKAYLPGEKLDGNGVLEMPSIEKCAMLPDEWFDALEEGGISQFIPKKDFGGYVKNRTAIKKWLEQKRFGGEPCAAFVRILEDLEENFGKPDPHHWFAPKTFRASCMAMEGHVGFLEFLNRCEDLFEHELEEGAHRKRDAGEVSREWDSLIDGAILSAMTKDEDGMFIGCPEKCSCRSVGSDGRLMHEINVRKYKLSDELEPCYEALGPDVNGEGCYIYGEHIHLVRNGKLSLLNADSMRVSLDRRVHCFTMHRVEGGATVQEPAIPTDALVRGLLSDASRAESLPALSALVRTPFWAYVGDKPTLIAKNGYHSVPKVFLDMEPEMELTVETVSGRPGRSELRRAVDLIDEMFSGFPFDSEADRASAYAALLTHPIRSLVSGPTPLFLFESPVAGTGKGLLADAISYVVCGGLDAANGYHMFGVRGGKGANTEMDKQMDSALRNSPSVVILDNIAHKLDSQRLASALSSYPNVSVRLLGKTQFVEVANHCLWIATANNLAASPEILRRVVPCRIDAKMAVPDEREFDCDLREWVKDYRVRLVWAVHTIVSYWVAKGHEPGGAVMGTFESWSSVMSGILECVGIDGLLENREVFRVDSNAEVSLDNFVENWVDWAGTGWENGKTAGELVGIATAEELELGEGRSAETRIGMLLGHKMRGVPVAGHTVHKRQKDGRSTYYLLPEGSEDAGRKRRKRRMAESE